LANTSRPSLQQGLACALRRGVQYVWHIVAGMLFNWHLALRCLQLSKILGCISGPMGLVLLPQQAASCSLPGWQPLVGQTEVGRISCPLLVV
jgi:hypothetical protein